MKSEKITQKIEDTLNSLDAIKQAEVSEQFYEQILSRLESSNKGKIISLQIVWQAAACIGLVVSLNFYTVWHFSQQKTKNNTELKSLAGEYFSDLNY